MELSGSAILKDFTATQIKRFNQFSKREKHTAKSKIVEEGHEAACFYIIENGVITISKDGVPLAVLETGEHFGLMAMIDGSPRSADAIANRNTVLIRVPFNSIKAGENQDIYQKIIANQLRVQQQQLRLMNDLTVSEIQDKITHVNRAQVIQAKSQQNEILLREIHHRVKNNLQMISSLLYLQSTTIKDDDAKKAIASSQQRVESMALIHKNLYQRENLADIEMKSYITQLTESLITAYRREAQYITVKIDMDELELNIDRAIPVGLIINELVINSFKYAFSNRSRGVIKIQMYNDSADKLILIISDNGIGKQETNKGFGTQLIGLLTKQLEGFIKESNKNGYRCKITI